MYNAGVTFLKVWLYLVWLDIDGWIEDAEAGAGAVSLPTPNVFVPFQI
jgi:hypothetical protein